MFLKKQALFWFRRDLRLEDNAGLFHALSENEQVLLLFIFDTDILDLLADRNDPRVTFIYETVAKLKETLQRHGSDLLIRRGKPLEVFQNLLQDKRISTVYANHDYEASARARDSKIFELLKAHGVPFKTYKDQCLFEKNEIMSKAGTSYTVFGPYKRKVLETLKSPSLKSYHCEPYRESYVKVDEPEAMLDLNDIGFIKSTWRFPSSKISNALLKNYERLRDFPAEKNGTSHLGIHLRFGTLSIREAARHAVKYSDVWLSELIWRDFFMQILWHFPYVETQSFRSEYDKISWRKSEKDFSRWCAGLTGYPLVDAGMRELNETGYMHNRARMVTASFLCKYLLIHWSHGEKYFARKLLDFDLAANNGNWQWVAGSGCDAAPYFRIFNPLIQQKKFDPKEIYIRKWIPEIGTSRYPQPIVNLSEARSRCLRAYTKALKR